MMFYCLLSRKSKEFREGPNQTPLAKPYLIRKSQLVFRTYLGTNQRKSSVYLSPIFIDLFVLPDI